jgi:hypothetical protein
MTPLTPEQLRHVAQHFGAVLHSVNNEQVGFALFVFPLGEKPGDGQLQYISNGRREDMVRVIESWLFRNGVLPANN